MLDKSGLTNKILNESNIKYCTGEWTNYEMYLLFLNIKSTKERYNIENFKEYFLRLRREDRKNLDIVQELSKNLLRTRDSIRQKLYFIYKNGTMDISEGSKPYSKEEEKKLLKFYTKYNGDWDHISSKMNRSIRSLRDKYHYMKYLTASPNPCSSGNPTPKHFTKQEDEKLLLLADEYQKNGVFGKQGNIPWSLLAKKLGNRTPRTYQQRFKRLTSEAGKMDAPTRYKLIIDVLRLLVNQDVQDNSDIDWEKVKASIGYIGLASNISSEFSRYMSRHVKNKNLTYKEILEKLSLKTKYA